MADRAEIERLVREAYATRLRGDLDGVCRLFAPDAKFEMAGARHASPVPLTSIGSDQYRLALVQIIKTFALTDHTILDLLIDGDKAAVHWRANVRSTLTGESVVTEVVDLIEIKGGRITSFTEFCDTAMAARLLSTREPLNA